MSSRGALDGLRVLEVSHEAGQLCGKLLADLGADVIRVEPPQGSLARRVGPFAGDMPDSNRSLTFWHYNTSKRSVTLDLDAREGQEIFRALAARRDIVLETESPGTMASRGLAYDDLAMGNWHLIYCSETSFGQSGPWSGYKACDLTLLALGGPMALCGYDVADDSSETPIAPLGGAAWHIGDSYAFIGILAALHNRDMRGRGEYIDVSIHEAISVCTEIAFPLYANTGQDGVRQTARNATVTPTSPIQFRCKDGRYVNCFIPRLSPEMFVTLRQWLAERGVGADLQDDALLDPEVLREHMPRVMEAVGRLCASLTSDEVYEGAQRRRFAWAPVRSPSELLSDPHLLARRFLVDVSHPEIEARVRYAGPPFSMSATPMRIRRRAPLLGEHNLEIYHHELGIPLERLSVLTEQGVI